MTFVSRTFLSDGWHGGFFVEGRGQSREEAKLNCLQNLEKHLELHVELADGVILPTPVAEEMPKELPEGLSLVVFERSSHCSGGPYDWRFFALRPSFYSIDGHGVEVVAGRPAIINTLDSNSDTTYPLPEGSMEYVSGAWLPSTGVEYHY